jgi:hypothetical protein
MHCDCLIDVPRDVLCRRWILFRFGSGRFVGVDAGWLRVCAWVVIVVFDRYRFWFGGASLLRLDRVLELRLLADEHFVVRFRIASRVPSGFCRARDAAGFNFTSVGGLAFSVATGFEVIDAIV